MDNILNALAEPNRRRIVELLRDQSLSVNEIVAQLEVLQPQVSKHLRVLSEAGLVEVQQIANKRIYSLKPEPFQEFDSWLATFRQIWTGRYDRLDKFLQAAQNENLADRTNEEIA